VTVFTRNECIFMGRLRSAPDLRKTPTGKTWAKMQLEVEQGQNKPVMVLDVSCWEEVARQVALQAWAGTVVEVKGRLTQRLYQSRLYYDVVADTVECITNLRGSDDVPPDTGWQEGEVFF